MKEEALKYHCKMNSADCAMDKANRKRGKKSKTSLKLLCGWKCGRLTPPYWTLKIKF